MRQPAAIGIPDAEMVGDEDRIKLGPLRCFDQSAVIIQIEKLAAGCTRMPP